MQTELLINVILLSVVGTFVIIIISVKIYISCCKPQEQTDTDFDLQTAQPQFDVKEQEIYWTSEFNGINKNQECCICLDYRVDTVTSCNHKFHMNCLIQWKKRMKNICPYCKSQSLSNITFYCQSCRRQKFQYKFQQPQYNPRNHMVPKFFLSFTGPQKKLKCTQCKQMGTQNPQCITRNFESVKGSEDYIKSNKTSRNRQPVDIVIKQSRDSQYKRSSLQSENNPQSNEGLIEPITGNRLLYKVEY